MITKKELRQFSWIQEDIRKLEGQLLELQTRATKITQQLSDMPKPPQDNNKDRMGDIVVNIMNTEKLINKQLKKGYRLQAKIMREVEILPYREKVLIISRYIEDKSWRQIAKEMHYCTRQILRIHGEALKKLERKGEYNGR